MPGLATGWRWLDDRTLEVTLRQGVIFQNGECFDAEIVQLNWDENIRDASRTRGVFDVPPGVTPGDRRCHTVRFLFRTGRGGPSRLPCCNGQPLVPSRTRLGEKHW